MATLEEINAKGAELDSKIKALDTKVKEIEDAKTEVLGGGGNYHDVFTSNKSGSSHEAKAARAFGVPHVKNLLGINVNHARYGMVDTSYKSAVLQLKESIDISRWISQIFHGDPKDNESQLLQPKAMHIFDSYYAKQELMPILKAFDSTTAGAGLEWVPTATATQYQEEFELERKLSTLVQSMSMPTDPFNLPVQTDVTIARITAENTAITGTNFGTAKITWNATKLGEFYPLSEELNEDSAPNIMAVARSEVGLAQDRAKETIILNGDTTGPHMDSDVTVASDARKLAKGLRKLALQNTANGGTVDFAVASVTTAKLDEMRVNMSKFGINVRDMIYVFSPSTYNQAVQLAEVSTVEKFGQQATILSGALAAFRGIPVIISEYQREDTNATGVYDGVTTDRGMVTLFNKKRFWVGQRRNVRIRVMQDLSDQDRWLLSSYQRMDFQGHVQSATEVSVVQGYNVAI